MNTNKNTVRLKGFKINNSVFIDGKFLKLSKEVKKVFDNDKFDWGWDCRGAKTLAVAILKKVGHKKVKEHYLEFAETFLYNLPANFDIEINLDKWKKWLKPPKDVAKVRTYLALSSVYISDDMKILKFMDFPHLDIKTAVFKNGTIEHRELFNLMYEDTLPKVEEYYKKETLRPDIKNLDVKIGASIRFNGMNNEFEYINGIGGRENYSGHKIDEYEE